MKTYRTVFGVALLSSVVAAGACNRAPAPEGTATKADATADRAAELERERAKTVADLQERVAKVERKYTENRNEVASGKRTATTGLREELKEDVTNVKEAVASLETTTADNWWERNEQAMTRTADDIEADVKRIAGSVPSPKTETATGTKGVDASTAPFTSRRDAFVASLRARVDAMDASLDHVKARGPRETELDDTRARLAKLKDDVDRLRSAEADDWWDVSKKRVTEYVDRVEASIGRLDDNKPRQ